MKVFVLGGGFAGLSAAVHLALEGYEVTLLERLPDVGGKAGEVAEGGFRFDTGPSVFTLPEVVSGIFERAGESLPFAYEPLEPLCRYIYPCGRVWDVSKDVEATTAQLTAEEARAYKSLLEEARTLYEGAAGTFLYDQAPGLLKLMRYGLRHGLRAHPEKTLPQLIRRHTQSEDLTKFFLRFATYFGADPYKAPAVLHNIAWVELGLGVYYPQGGIKTIVRALESLACRKGVEIRTGVTVERLELAASRVARVYTDAGVFEADAVVSALDIIRTNKLLGRETRLERLAPSLSGFVLLLGLEGVTEGLKHHTILFPQDYRAEFGAIAQGLPPHDPTLYVSIGSKSDPTQAPEGCENLFVMANAPALPTGGYDWGAEGKAYGERLLELLATRGFPVSGRVRVQQTLTPEGLATLAHRGSIYGVAPHSLLSTIRPKQTLPGLQNLVLAGGSVHPGGGIPLAILSGQHAADLVRRHLLPGKARRSDS